jgi:hypothetical protein
VLDCCLADAVFDHHSSQQRRKQAQQKAEKSSSSSISGDSWQKSSSETTSTTSQPTAAAAAAGSDATAAAAELPAQPNVRLLQQPPKQGVDVEVECAPTQAAATSQEHRPVSQLKGLTWETICECGV